MPALDKTILTSLYPEYADKKADIHRYTMFPVGVPSDHKGKKVTFTKEGAQKLLAKSKGAPLLYAESEGLPSKHRDKNGNRKMIGNVIGGGTVMDNGVEWVYADCAVYNDVDSKTHKTMMDNIDDLGTSIESDVVVDNDNNIYDGSFDSLSIVNNKNTAWKTMALVADNGETVVEVKYDDILKQLVNKDYEEKLKADVDAQKKDLELQNAELLKQLTEKEDLIERLRSDKKSLEELNQSFSDLIN